MILFILITIFSSANLSHGFSKTSPGTSKPSPSVITSPPKTSAVLRVTYDGTLFHGWSASNDGSATNGIPKLNKRGRSRRNRNRPSVRKGEVRSVEGTLRYALSKLYGNVGVDRIIVEGCSRTDAGVSARHMIALIYCLYEDDGEEGLNRGTLAIEGKRLPHPTSPTDEGFMPLPFKGDLSKMMYALNKMLPPDVRIRDTSSTPTINGTYESGERKVPFHPSLETVTKTYSYTFSVGDLHDPIRCRNVWHVQNAKSFEISRAQECASILRGEHDFIAFRGAFRGNERGKIQNTICRLQEITITEEEDGDQFPFCTTYKVTVTGDRFLYKMMRFIVGTLVEYGIKEKLSLQEVSNALSTGEWGGVVDDAPSCPRTCAPANGLVLDNIDYGDKWDFDWIAESL